MTTMKNWSDVRAEPVERVHPLLELDRAQLLGRALGRLAVEQRLDDAVDEDPGEAQRDDRGDDDRARTGTTSSSAATWPGDVASTVWRLVEGARHRGHSRSVRRARAVRRRRRQPDRDGRGGLARLGRQLGDAPRRQPEGRAPDVDRGDDVAARVVDRRGDRVEPELVLADGRRVAAPADAGELLEQRLELDDRPLRVADEAAADDPQDLALGERRQQDLAGRDAVERRRPAGPVADRDEVRAVDLGDREHRVAVEDAEAGRLVGQAGQPLELGQGDAAQVERPLGAFGEADDDEAEPVLAGLVVLLDEAALLERRQQARRGRLVEPEPARELGHAGLALASRRARAGAPPPGRPSGRRCRRGPSRPVRSSGARVRHRAGWPGPISPWARASRAASSESEKIDDDPVDDVALGVRLAEEPRLARVGLGHRAAGVHPERDRVVQLVVGGRPVAVLGRLDLGEHDPEHRSGGR